MVDQMTPRRHKQIIILTGMVVLLCVCFSVAIWAMVTSSDTPVETVGLGTFDIIGSSIVHRSTTQTGDQPLEVTDWYLSQGWQRGPSGILFTEDCLYDRLCITRVVISDPVSDQLNVLKTRQIIGIKRVR